MTEPTRDARHEDLGLYVLGALEPVERDRFEAHLATCRRCREELADLAVVPTLLGRLRTHATIRDTPPDFAPVAARIAQARRSGRRRERFILAAAAIVALSAVTVLALPPQGGPAGHALASADGAVTATLEAKTWGMAVHLVARDLPERPGYTAIAVGENGHRTAVASWRHLPRPVSVTGACYLSPDDVARVEVVDPDDAVVAVLMPD